MNANNLLVSSLLFTACGTVIDPDAAEPTGTGDTVPEEPRTPEHDPELPMIVEAPRAAVTAPPLATLAFPSGNVSDLIQPGAGDFAVVEQRIIPSAAGSMPVRMSLSIPTGTYTRHVASDVLTQVVPWFPEQFLCSENNVQTGDIRCSTATPASSLSSASGPITNARWRLAMIDESSNTSVESCVASGLELDCVLEGGTSYRFVAYVDGAAELWPSALPLALQNVLHTADGFNGTYAMFMGAVGPSEYKCTGFQAEPSSSRVWCVSHQGYARIFGLDSAQLAFDPMTITLATGQMTKTFTSPAISWTSGDNDLPGPSY